LEQTGVKIDIVKSKYRSSNIKGYDIIVLALDNLETRKQIVEDVED
jgi:molybdopterin/thiamine biosynthesis adenylyltransferase